MTVKSCAGAPGGTIFGRIPRRVGFDEVEIPDAMAERQPEDQWRPRPQVSYQQHLSGTR